MATVVLVRVAGWRAEAALRRTLGQARVLAVLADSRYLTVKVEQLLWLGPAGAALHGRALVAAGPLPDVGPGEDVELDTRGARVWRPRAVVSTRTTAELRSSVGALVAALASPEPPPGFGALVAGAPLAFPIERAVAPARALAEACAGDDAEAAATAAVELIGLGPGLTPAGDDFVGGTFFARAKLGPRVERSLSEWARAAAAVVAVARERTHPISHALLTDLVRGHGHAPLHELADLLATETPLAQALDAARRVTRIGHSSGWDMLAGFLIGLAGC